MNTTQNNKRRNILLTLIVLSAVCLQIDWWLVFDIHTPRPETTIEVEKGLKDKNLESMPNHFLLHQYENGVKEIRSRSQQKNLLFAMKFSLVGAILAMLFYNYAKGRDKQDLAHLHFSPTAALFLWASAITCGIIDIRILFHENFIGRIGAWIRRVVEPKIYNGELLGWENFLRHSDLVDSQVFPLLQLHNCLLTLVIFIVTAVIITTRNELTATENSESFYGNKVNMLGSILCLVIFGLAGIHFHYNSTGWLTWCVGWTAVGIMAAILLWRNKKMNKFAPTS